MLKKEKENQHLNIGLAAAAGTGSNLSHRAGPVVCRLCSVHVDIFRQKTKGAQSKRGLIDAADAVQQKRQLQTKRETLRSKYRNGLARPAKADLRKETPCCFHAAGRSVFGLYFPCFGTAASLCCLSSCLFVIILISKISFLRILPMRVTRLLLPSLSINKTTGVKGRKGPANSKRRA